MSFLRHEEIYRPMWAMQNQKAGVGGRLPLVGYARISLADHVN